MAQYHRRPYAPSPRIQALEADLSTLAGVRAFWDNQAESLRQVRFFFSNYGPMSHKATEDLEFEDFCEQITAHLAPLVFLVRRMREQGVLRGVMVSGMADYEPKRGYRQVAAHACAKGLVETVLASWKLVWPDLFCQSWPVPTLKGARFPRSGYPEADPSTVAGEMVRRMMMDDEEMR
jgi:NAD(P)-dependent dehydrogenase (short-subunit alcohol dehydrogenase family)